MPENEKNEKRWPEGYIRKGGTCVLPEVTFTTLIMSLNTSALYHLGDIEDPETGQTVRDLVLAKHTIGTLQLLQDKTRGNLIDKEEALLGHVLADLKLRYVKACG
jgi:hypothetical protein